MLRLAVADLSWLLSRGYGWKSSLKLVGDRYDLNDRQRIAVMRSSCSDDSLAGRRSREVGSETLTGRNLLIDGYNVLTTMEALLAGGVLLRGRDGCVRDMTSMHGSYRKVAETESAIDRIGRYLVKLGLNRSVWLLDSPVSNSGRLKGMLKDHASDAGWAWSVYVVIDPDSILISSGSGSNLSSLLPADISDVEGDGQCGECLVASADSVVLDGCGRWFNLASELIKSEPEVRIINLGDIP